MTSSCKGYVREKVVFINRDDLCLNDDADADDEINRSRSLARSLDDDDVAWNDFVEE